MTAAPSLFMAAALKAFISAKQEAKAAKMRGRREFFCFRCRAPRKPWGNIADAYLSYRKNRQADRPLQRL